MATEYWKAGAEEKELLREIVGAHHTHLAEARIVILFRKPAASRDGVTEFGKASLVPAKYRVLTNADFLVVLGFEPWEQFIPQTRRAALDHELSHCTVEWAPETDETGRVVEDASGEPVLTNLPARDSQGHIIWKIRHHDIEEFTGVIERNGLWREGLKNAGRVIAEQLELPLEATA